MRPFYLLQILTRYKLLLKRHKVRRILTFNTRNITA